MIKPFNNNQFIQNLELQETPSKSSINGWVVTGIIVLIGLGAYGWYLAVQQSMQLQRTAITEPQNHLKD